MSDCCNGFELTCQQNSFDMSGGIRGSDGTTFYPHVSADGVLSWTNDGGKPNPAPVNIKGADGTPGKSAYAAAQEAGFTGTEAEFNAYLSGIGDLTREVADQKSAIAKKAGMLVDTASGAIASFVPDATIPNLLGVSVAVEPVQAGSGDPSPDNVRPISGWDAVGIDAAGQNLFDGVYRYHGAASLTPVKAGQTYTISTKHVSGGEGLNICFFDGTTYSNDQSVIQTGSTATTAHLTFSVPAGKTHVNVYTVVTGSNTNNALFDTQIQPGSAISPYEEYRAPTTITIQLGQTVYGAKLTISEDWSVTALVDRALDTVDGSQNLGYNGTLPYGGGEVIYYPASAKKLAPSSATQNEGLISDKFKTDSAYLSYPLYATGRAGNGNIYFSMPEGITTAALAKTWFSNNPTQISYLLANPFEIQLDPVTIATISGQPNNVWADAGDVDVTYAADIKAYIDRLNQPTEDDMIANTLIAANKYFTINNKLYLSTASIAVGAQIIPGTNCVETSLVEALNALNA